MKWTQEGDKVTLTMDGETAGEFTVKGNKLEATQTYEGITYTQILVQE